MLVSRNSSTVDLWVGAPGAPFVAARGAGLWAPDVVYSTTFRRYYMTYTVTNTVASVSGEPGCPNDRAIGLATSASPVGPWLSTRADL